MTGGPDQQPHFFTMCVRVCHAATTHRSINRSQNDFKPLNNCVFAFVAFFVLLWGGGCFFLSLPATTLLFALSPSSDKHM